MNSKTKNQPGPRGLKNFGNTCYINSIMQCLTHLIMSGVYFMSGFNCLGGQVTREMSNLYKSSVKFFDKHRCGLLLESELLEFVSDFFKACQPNMGFTLGTQQDAQEFLSYLLNQLETSDLDVFYVDYTQQPAVEINNLAMLGQQIAYEKETLIRRTFYSSLIVEKFCTVSSHKFEPINEIQLMFQLPIDTSSNINSIHNMIQTYLNNETLLMRCPDCLHASNVPIKSYRSFSRLPPVLIVQIKRFDHNQVKNFLKLHFSICFG